MVASCVLVGRKVRCVVRERESQYSRGPTIERRRNNPDEDRSHRLSRSLKKRDCEPKAVKLDVIVCILQCLDSVLCVVDGDGC